MVVLRKEIKIGIGAGLAILGIAGVYGLMASLSSNGDSKDSTQLVSNDEMAKRQQALSEAVSGPVDDDKGQNTTPAPKPAFVDAGGDAKTDPFTELKRTDGNTGNADVWNTALSTGRIDTIKASTPAPDNAPAVIKAPVKPTGTLVRTDTFGNDSPDAPAPKPAAANAMAAGGTKYKIEAGDTFSTISQKFYGSKKFYAVLAKANPDVSPKAMKVGHEITVPAKDAVASVGGAVDVRDVKLAAPIDATQQYRVAAGDTLSRISQKLYHKSTMWQEIYAANKAAIGPDAARLKLGTVLTLPQKPAR